MIQLIENCDFKDAIAVFPSVSVGNVGQLSADLLVSSLNLKKIGYLWHPNVLAFAGADPFGNSSAVSTGCELFYSQNLKLLVFQVRSAITKNKNTFLEDLCKWLKEKQVRQVIILSGVSAHERRDEQLVGEPLRFLFCPLTKKEEIKNAENRNWVELESRGVENDSSLSYIPGAGISIKLFQKCIKEKIPCAVLLEFCSDGNNMPDAMKLTSYLDEWLQLKDKSKIDTWIIPPSWNFLFGPLPPTEIFN